MRRGGDDEHDILARRDPAITVDHRHAEQRPASLRLFHMARDFRLRHLCEMFEGQGGDRIAGLAAAADAGEGDDRADIAAPARERGCFRGCVEILALQANGPCSLRHSAATLSRVPE